MAWGELVKNSEYSDDESGLYSVGNGEPLEASEKIRDHWSYSFPTVRL